MDSPSPLRSSFSWGLYLISDDRMLREGFFFGFLEGALEAGLRAVQLRCKTFDDRALEKFGTRIRGLTRRYGADFIVNDRPGLALRLNADGVHLGQEDRSPEEAREILGPDRIIGLSTHGRRQIIEAGSRPVDYVGVGPVFATRTKKNPDEVMGTELLEWAGANCALPVVAIGGITLENLDRVLETGVSNVAVISEISQSPDPLGAAKAFIRRLGEP